LEFGCSWGYGAWQMARAGYDVTALEVSAPRCAYARKELGVKAVEEFAEIEGTFDLVFSSHVLEHVDRLGEVVARLWHLTNPGGWMIHLIPNGSAEYAAAAFGNWHQLWGQVHPQLPDSEFWRKWFRSEPFYLSATPVGESELADWDPGMCRTGKLDSGELLVVARKR
jgi:cyclopropane fatty-acyl-phospholipid synthase-like methyltransferase